MSETKKPLRVKCVLGSTKGKLVRFSYLNAHEARLNGESGKMEYSVMALIPKANAEDVLALQNAIDALKKHTWLDEKKKVPPQFWNPLKDGDVDTKQNGDPMGAECKGHYVLNCKTGEDSPPYIVSTVKDASGKYLSLAKHEVKSGDWGRISINLSAYTKGTGGVGAYLSGVQLVQAGEPLSTRATAEDDFGDFDEGDDAALD